MGLSEVTQIGDCRTRGSEYMYKAIDWKIWNGSAQLRVINIKWERRQAVGMIRQAMLSSLPREEISLVPVSLNVRWVGS